MKPKARFYNNLWYCKDSWAIGVGKTLQEAYEGLVYWNMEGCCPVDNETSSPWYIYRVNS